MALDEILARKRVDVAARKRNRPLDGFAGALVPSDRSLEHALRAPRCGFVMECKHASPSQGIIRPDYDPAAIARSYAPFADAISVLCDEPFFGGSFAHLRQVRAAAPQPVLCKDFVVDPYQVHEARLHGADAILLMCSVLDDDGLAACLSACRTRAMDALVEVHDEDELRRAVAAGARIVGVNNRNLRTLAIDLQTTRRLAPLLPPGVVSLCESGIRDHHDARELRPLVDGFLVGTSLMARPDLDAAVRELLFGRVKICGLTRPEQAAEAHAAGARFGGLVRWPGSPRHVDDDAAREVAAGAPLGWVGVYVDAPAERVAADAEALGLCAVQLHGQEDALYVARLRPRLPPETAIWKAQRLRDGAAIEAAPHVDRVLVDAFDARAPGGTGRRFDWAAVRASEQRTALVLSGGISPGNAAEADALGTWGLDLSSGVERAPGDKDPDRMRALFAALRGGGEETHRT